jgi:protein XagA
MRRQMFRPGVFSGAASRLFRARLVASAAAGGLVGLLVCAPAKAGAWIAAPGHGEIIVATQFDQANIAFNQAGKFTPTPLYRSLTVGAYVEIGVLDGLAAVLKPSLQSSSLGPPDNQRYTGLGESEIGAKARLWRDDTTTLAILADLRVPATGGATDTWLAGSRTPAFDLRLLLGKNISLGALPGFVDLSAGGRLNGGGAPNEARADLTLGVYLTPRLMLLAQSFNSVSAPSQNPNDPQWAQSKAQISCVYSLNPDWRVQAGAFTTLAGRNAYRENGAVLAVWRAF